MLNYLRYKDYLLIVSILFIAFLIRLFGLESESLWIDELHTAIDSTVDAKHLWFDAYTNKPPLFYQLISLFWQVEDGEFFVRLPSVIAGVLCILVVWFYGRKIFSSESLLYILILITVSPLFVKYSQEARQYIFVVLGYIFLSFQCLRIIDKLQTDSLNHRDIALLMIPSALMIQMHLTSLIYIFTALMVLSFIVLKFYPTKKTYITYFFLYSLVPLLSIAIWLFPLSQKVAHGGETMHILPHSLIPSFVCYIKATFVNWIIAIMAFIGFYREYSLKNKITAISCILFTVIPFLLVYLIGLIKPILAGRIFLPGHFFCLVGLVFLIQNSSSKIYKNFAIFLIFLVFLQKNITFYSELEKTDWRGAINEINRNFQPNDIIVSSQFDNLKPFYFYSFAKIPYAYLLIKNGTLKGDFVAANDAWKSRCFENSCESFVLSRIPQDSKRVWNLRTEKTEIRSTSDQMGLAISDLLQMECSLAKSTKFEGLVLNLYDCIH